MTRAVWIDGSRVALTPVNLIGQGGEAEVYDLRDGRVVKWWKPSDHPDFVGMPEAQAAASQRLIEAPRKLRALPAGLPPAVVAPSGFALAAKRSAELAGYVMQRVAGTPLHSYGEPRWRRDNRIDGNDIVAVLVALYDAISALHHAGVVVGDCNDLNVLVEGTRVHLIDVDSYQFAGFACSMFSERFVDPRVCSKTQLVPIAPHDRGSDWFAFAAMALRTLVQVGPWGGVAKQCPLVKRPLERVSVLSPGVVYPRAAKVLETLPDDVLAAFRSTFESDDRSLMTRELFARLRFRRCSTCGDEHARVRCPTCATTVVVPAAIVHGTLRMQAIAASDVSLVGARVGRRDHDRVWLDAGALWRKAALGPQRIGGVLDGQTRAWVGPKLGVGFYRAGGYATAFAFRPDRGVLDDRIALPPIRGTLVDAFATIGDDRAWLWLVCADAGRITTTAIVIDTSGSSAGSIAASIVATEQLVDMVWLAGIAGACAAGPLLFVPTDDGIARIEVVASNPAGMRIVHTRTFAETASLVSSADRLAIAPGGQGIDVVRARDAIRLSLS